MRARTPGTELLRGSLRVAAVLGGIWAGPASPVEPAPFTGFTAKAAREQLVLEERFAASLDASNLRVWLQEIAARPHHTGSPGGRRVAEFLAARFQSWGFQTAIETSFGLMSTPRERIVEMVAPKMHRAALTEPPIPGHTPNETEGSLPPYNVFSRDGDVTAQAVYVNYGLPDDYEWLARRGVDVKGKIVIARYGRAYRGIKPRLAGEHGATGALLFSDPADYGYAQGVAFPKGPFLPIEGYQRGSVLDVTRFAGDPLTPGRGATTKPESFSLKKASGISPVPVLPLSASDIRPILEAMEGPVAPPEWRGALPITYRIGGNVTVRIKVAQDWAVVPLHNVVARLEGATWPDEWVLRGNNHDAWNYGALVAGSGLVALMEEARAIGSLTRNGWRPKRTLVYLAWDGESQGLMGSTEWAETHADELRAKAVSYLNSGITTRGFFAAGGSHSLESLVNDVARVVKDPRLNVPVFERAAALLRINGDESDRRDLEASKRLRLAALGLGSDHTPFLQHLGIASLDFAFEGEAESGVYQSTYDNFDFYDRFGDPGYRYGTTLAEASGRAMLRLANAHVLPFEFSGASHAIAAYVAEVEGLADGMRMKAHSDKEKRDAGLDRLVGDRALLPAKNSIVPPLDFAALKEATAQLAGSAMHFSRARERFEQSSASPGKEELVRLNEGLRRAEQALAPAHGLPGRPWYRHYIYAPGIHTGYAVKTLPSVREAVETRDWKQARSEIPRLAAVIRSYAERIDACTQLLERLPASVDASQGARQ